MICFCNRFDVFPLLLKTEDDPEAFFYVETRVGERLLLAWRVRKREETYWKPPL